MQIEQHYLTNASTKFTTENISGALLPKYICLYAVCSPFADIWDIFESPSFKESAHLFITQDICYQMAPFNVKTWHAGASNHQGHYGLNNSSIGVYYYQDSMYQAPVLLYKVIETLVQAYNIRDIIARIRPFTTKVAPMVLDSLKPLVEYGNSDSLGRFIVVLPTTVFNGPSEIFSDLDTLNAGESVKVLKLQTTLIGEWALVLYERRDHVIRQGWVYYSNLRRL